MSGLEASWQMYMERLSTVPSLLTSWLTRLKRKTKLYLCQWNLLLLTLLGASVYLLFKGFLVYFLCFHFWPPITCGMIRELHPILVVAGPRILGESSSYWFSRWADDRYLKRSFAAALNHVEPETVVFLGNLMDEGSTASDEEYQRYYQRFKEIFQLDYIPVDKTIFIPGNSDIGRNTTLTDERKYRFKHHFRSPTSRYLSNIQIIQVDKPQQSVPLPPGHVPDNNWTRVVISQIPLLADPDAFTGKVLQTLRPHAMLSAPDYTDTIPEDGPLVQFSGNVDTGKRLTVETMSANWCIWGSPPGGAPSWRFQWSDRQVAEVVVPTCSRRSRVAEIGYGVAVFDKRREAWCFHVLWLPSDFHMVATYLSTAAVMFVSVLGLHCYRRYHHSCCKSHPQYKPL